MEFVRRLGGKKFTALIAYILVVCFGEKVGMTPADVQGLSDTLKYYFIGQGVADGFSKGATSHS